MEGAVFLAEPLLGAPCGKCLVKERINPGHSSLQLDIPDFTNKEEREAARANDLTPYDTDGKPASLPQHLFLAE